MRDSDRSRPNILWIVSEDCPPWLGAYGDDLARTPHLDALAKRATLFERAYSPAPVCAPSRFALLTGVSPESHSPADRMRALASLPSWMSTYPELLRAAGYYCTNNAKTDYNADVDAESIWNECSRAAHWRNRPEGVPFLAVFNIDGTHESSVFDPDSAFVRAVARFMPGLPDPAPEVVAPEEVRVPEYLPDTAEIRGDFARYYGIVSRMDGEVGSLLAQLADDGLADDTIVIYTSDHGGVTPRSKRYCYEEGLHVPLMVASPSRWAETFPPGLRVQSPVSTISVPSTLYELAGVEPPVYVQGPSLSALVGEDPGRAAYGARNRMDERFDLVRTIRGRRYRYLHNYTPHRPVIQYQAFAWNAAGYRSWEAEHLAGRLTAQQERWWQPKPPVELYDLDADPDEVNNLAGQPEHAEVEHRLRSLLRQRALDIHDNGFLPEDSPSLGYDNSRRDGAYPLERILDLADAGLEGDPQHIPEFTRALQDADDTIRRWGAIGLLRLAPDIDGDAISALRDAMDRGPDSVTIPAAEAIARASDTADAYRRLVHVARSAASVWTQLEAVDALTALPADRVLPYIDELRELADSQHEYLGSAGRYLLLRLEGRYHPGAEVFSAQSLLAGIGTAT